jgi:two-component system phosphate regulon sensor histidine kinase PhoR
MRKSIFFKIFISFFLIAVLLSGLILIFSFNTIRGHYIHTLSSSLENLAISLKLKAVPLIRQKQYEQLDSLVKELADNISKRITIITPKGEVLADSEEDPQHMENHSNRPEVIEAISKGKGSSLRFSTTVRKEMLYVAVPLKYNGKLIGILRTSMFLEDINTLLNKLKNNIMQIVAVIVAISLIAALLFSRGFSRPIHQLSEASKKVASSDFTPRVFLKGKSELKELADSFNYMTEKMQELFYRLSGQKQQLNSIISSIPEGLLVIGNDEKVRLSNESIADIIGAKNIEGKYYWEVLREPDFSNFLKEIKDKKSASTEIINLRDRTFICSAVYLKRREEVVVVFHDITEMKRLEKIKRDFVTNVSHELRTPLTALKGYAETLEGEVKKENKHYVDIIKRHTDRLINIVNDLLILSKVEGKDTGLELEEVNVKDFIDNTVKIFSQQAKKKGLSLEINIDENVGTVTADSFKLEQMLMNLIDNAVKYTEEGKVKIEAKRKKNILTVKVKDTGIGIPEKHLNRIFERFYVVDKSRTKTLGGTGLGLSIVKHIVLLHGGDIDIKSTPGEGTTFIAYLPTKQA